MIGPIFSLSGPPGSGKSTLARGVAARTGATVVEYDRYEVFTRVPLDEVRRWLDQGAPYEDLVAPGLAEAVASAARRGPVILDSPLGPADPVLGSLIAKAVWIDCPLDLALARKLAQLASGVPSPRSEAFLSWMRDYLAAYPLVVQRACLIQRERVAPRCDLALDGRQSVNDLLPKLAQFFADDGTSRTFC